jgi:galactokinase
MSITQSQILDRVVQFQEKLGLGKPLIIKSPGRINLIGEHTDYNNGFVLPGAVDKSVVLAFTPRTDDIVKLHSIDYNAAFQTSLSVLESSELEWPNLVLGVLAQMGRSCCLLSGFDLVYGADLPRGAGLSSSSAVACGVIFGLNKLFDIGLSIDEMTRIAVFAEHEYMGVNCGVMDQYVNLRAKEHSVLLLDCKELYSQHVPLDQDKLCIALCDSQVRRKLAQSNYNKRRAQCEEGVAAIAEIQPGIQSLRDVSMDLLQSSKNHLSSAVYKRCRYVIEENSRVLKTCKALENKDFSEIRDLLYASHEGLRDLYRVSCAELNQLVDGALCIDGVYGARLMGAGFGGCTINLVETAKLGTFLSEMTKVFRDKLNKSPKIHITVLSNGTHVVEL